MLSENHYYLSYAIQHGLLPNLAHRLTSLTLAVVVVSIIIHGLSVTPLMRRYGTWQERDSADALRRVKSLSAAASS